MRRLISIAAFALLLSVPLCAQRGGHAGGGHPGISGGHGGGFAGGGHAGGFSSGGGHFSGGMRSGPGVTHGFTHHPGVSHGPFLHNGFHGSHAHISTFHNNCFGFPCRRFSSPWWGVGYYNPWWSDSGSSYDEDYERDRAIANEMDRQSLEQQRMLRQEESDGDQDAYAPRSASRSSRSADINEAQKPEPIMPPTVLVFRDDHRREITNYAIVGQTLWNFAAGRTEKIPLANLDVPATEKVNEDRGVTFRVPTGEAQ